MGRILFLTWNLPCYMAKLGPGPKAFICCTNNSVDPLDCVVYFIECTDLQKVRKIEYHTMTTKSNVSDLRVGPLFMGSPHLFTVPCLVASLV